MFKRKTFEEKWDGDVAAGRRQATRREDDRDGGSKDRDNREEK